MKAKYVGSLLTVIFLTTGMALAQNPTPAPDPPNPMGAPAEDVITLFVDGGFLGVYAEDIRASNLSQYSLSQVRGVGVTSVVKDSPAEKAGLRKGDVILRIDGENVTSVRKLNRVVSEIAPEQSVKVTISRGGAEQELTATIGRNKASGSFQKLFGDAKSWKLDVPGEGFKEFKWEGFNDGDNPMVFALGASRRIGVSTVELTKQLADFFGIAGGKGVLVTSVTEDGPAAKAGVRAGDVITAVDGETIDTSGDISRVINRKKEGEIVLTMVRNKSPQTIRVMPKESGLSTTDLGRPQIGRQIVIPRIVFPTIPDVNVSMPEVNISMPRIEIPTVPSINIEMPRIRVTPRVRMIKKTSGPI